MIENQLSDIIIGKAIEVHKFSEPGILESAYQECPYYELITEELTFKKEKPLPIEYKDIKLEHGYRIDLLVSHKVEIEIRHAEVLTDVQMV